MQAGKFAQKRAMAIVKDPISLKYRETIKDKCDEAVSSIVGIE